MKNIAKISALYVVMFLSIAVLLVSYSFPRRHNSSPLKRESFFSRFKEKEKLKEERKKEKSGKIQQKTSGIDCSYPSGKQRSF